MREIAITEIENVKIGQSENREAGTGCTVIVCEKGAPAGLSVRGGGPASRESELLKAEANAQYIHAVTFAGGSAFGLDAAGGVMQCLEENGIGLDVSVTKVPLVCQASLFDLTVGDTFTRPDKKMGYEACANALNGGNYRDGNYGAGTGATVGKLYGMDYCMKSGIGSYAVSIGELKVGAIVAVNALGNIYDWKNGKMIAGLLDESRTHLRSSTDEMYKKYDVVENKFAGNTTLGIIITNAKFDKARLNKIAGMAHNGYARTIRPVHTSADGDSIFAMSVGEIAADMDMVGTLASDVMAEAVLRAVRMAESAYGYTSVNELQNINSMSAQFSRTQLLLGEASLEKLKNSRVAVFGVGGVGGFVCEALVRSGIGAFDLIDDDKVCPSNLNRQIIATRKTVGEYKVDVMRDRMLEINPDVDVRVYKCFFLPGNADEFPFSEYDYVIDAVDTVTAKIELVMKCQEEGVPIISSMGAGNKLEASAFKVADIYKTKMCPLAKVMRHELKKRGVKELKVVYSEENPARSFEDTSSGCGIDDSCHLGVEYKGTAKREAPGSVAFVPSAAGLIIAGEVVKDITGKKGIF